MNQAVRTLLGLAIVATGCTQGENTSSARPSPETASGARGGTLTVADRTYSVVPSVQCSVYPNNQVNIAGHAAEDESLEVTIDFYPDGDGPSGVTLGTDGREGSWFSMRETLQWRIDAQRVSGTATFSEYRGGMGKTAEGSFDISC